MSKYLSVKKLKIPGHYWWLPECNMTQSDKDECWKIISWHPLDESRVRSGIAYGPIEAPIIPTWSLNKFN